jgi:hypothetical protein
MVMVRTLLRACSAAPGSRLVPTTSIKVLWPSGRQVTSTATPAPSSVPAPPMWGPDVKLTCRPVSAIANCASLIASACDLALVSRGRAGGLGAHCFARATRRELSPPHARIPAAYASGLRAHPGCVRIPAPAADPDPDPRHARIVTRGRPPRRVAVRAQFGAVRAVALPEGCLRLDSRLHGSRPEIASEAEVEMLPLDGSVSPARSRSSSEGRRSHGY